MVVGGLGLVNGHGMKQFLSYIIQDNLMVTTVMLVIFAHRC